MIILYIKSKPVFIIQSQCRLLQPVKIIRKHKDKHPINIKVKINPALAL